MKTATTTISSRLSTHRLLSQPEDAARPESGLSLLPRGRARRTVLALLTGVALLLGAVLLLHRPLPSPAEAQRLYQAGQHEALHHRYAAAAVEFRRAKELSRGDLDRQAWCDYQLCSLLEAQPAQRGRALGALHSFIRTYPRHFLSSVAENALDRLTGRVSRSNTPPRPDVSCGPETLAYLLLHAFGKHVPVSELRRLAGTGRYGTTLLGLKKAAGAEGIGSEGLRLDLPYLRHLGKPAILWVRRSHYVALLNCRTTLAPPFWCLEIWDPTGGGLRTLRPEDLSADFDGYLLALSRSAANKRYPFTRANPTAGFNAQKGGAKQ